eukprot:Hpha_TRINITY_DN15141_c0_g3::TRINITY_DN15141_c0_g3_i1::g.128748::m.128748
MIRLSIHPESGNFNDPHHPADISAKGSDGTGGDGGWKAVQWRKCQEYRLMLVHPTFHFLLPRGLFFGFTPPPPPRYNLHCRATSPSFLLFENNPGVTVFCR